MTGEDLNPGRVRVGGEIKEDDTVARNPDRPSTLPLINAPELEDEKLDKKTFKRLSSPQRWEIKQMIAGNCIDKTALPDFDEETGLLPKEDDSGNNKNISVISSW